MYHCFLIHSSADGHLGCFHVLALINSAVMNIGVHVSLSLLVSSVCMPSSGIAGSYFSTFINLFAFPTLLFLLQLIFNEYKLSLSTFNFAYLLFLLFPFLSTCLLVLFSLLYSPHGTLLYFHFLVCALVSLILTCRYHFQFPLFTRSIYCTLFLLDCFDFVYRCICICVYSISLIIICLIL